MRSEPQGRRGWGTVPRGSGAMPPFLRSEPRAGEGEGGVPRGLGIAQAVANYLCRSRRPGVHTAIICVGRDGRAYTDNYQLFMYVGASTAQYSWSIYPPAVRALGRRGWGPSPGARAQAGCCQLFVWVEPSSRTHTIANYL